MVSISKSEFARAERKKPLLVACTAIAVGSAAILIAAYLRLINAETIVGAFGAIGQVAIAIFLYFLTKSQLGHSKIEAEYSRKELVAEKASSELEHKRYIFESVNTFKTRIGKKVIDPQQVASLDGMRVQVKIYFRESSVAFNRAVNAARCAMAVGNEAIRDEELEKFNVAINATYGTMLSTLNAAIARYNDVMGTLQTVYSEYIEPELNIRLIAEDKNQIVGDGGGGDD